jgi:hypothetical protein
MWPVAPPILVMLNAASNAVPTCSYLNFRYIVPVEPPCYTFEEPKNLLRNTTMVRVLVALQHHQGQQVAFYSKTSVDSSDSKNIFTTKQSLKE